MTEKPDVKLTPLCEEHISKGDWNPLWNQLREIDPEFIESYLNFRSVPKRNGPLPEKFKEMIMVAVNASTTHLYAPGVRRHIHNAFKAGATTAELLEVIQLTTVVGIHACNLAVPILLEEAEQFERTDLDAEKDASTSERSISSG